MTKSWRWTAAPAIAAGLGAQLWALPLLASHLSWSGPAECDASEQLVFQIERALGAPLAEVGQLLYLRLQVHAEPVAADARARLRIGSTEEGRASGTGTRAGQRERRLVAPDCARLVDALAVAITLALEADFPPSRRKSWRTRFHCPSQRSAWCSGCVSCGARCAC
jgi:hypothetical protein